MKILPHMAWDGKILNYTSWKNLIKKKLEDFQSEEEKVFFVVSHIRAMEMKALIEDCSSAEDIWHHLDAWNPIEEVLCGMKMDLNNLTSYPESYQVENHNIQALLSYVRACRRNDMLGPHWLEVRQFLASFKDKLRNPEKLEGISDIEEFLKFLWILLGSIISSSSSLSSSSISFAFLSAISFLG